MELKSVEKKWQRIWQEGKYFEASNSSDKEKYYILVEFPYPSGSGLHVGHVRSYTALDVMARLKRMQGFNVLFPMGWDAFGAPAEQYAIKNKIHPAEAVKENVKTFKGQIQDLGMSFDWSREYSTTNPEYYKWTQWQFLQFVKAGMAYKAEKEINWCPDCKTGLSNEDAAGGVCERCGARTTKKLKSQWMLKMQSYAESLLDGLCDTDFMDKIKTAQVNWIGKSVGAEVDFKIKNTDDYLKVFTTRADTLFGVTFMVMSPEHAYLEKYRDRIENIEEVSKYQSDAKNKSEIERTDATKEKTGVLVKGLEAINPVNGSVVPIWISDYVLATYGTGAIMAVPAHDERDYAFAKRFGIPIKQVIAPYFEGTGESKVRPDKENTKRRVVNVIVKHPDKDEYLVVNNDKFGFKNFVMGGIEGDESVIEAAARELREETGFVDYELDYVFDFVYKSHFYAAHKDVNRDITCYTVVFNLKSLKQVKISLGEMETQYPVWVKKSEVIDYITTNEHKFSFEYYLKKSTLFDGHDGVAINSDFIDGLQVEDAILKMIEYLEDKKIGKKTINYRLQDWIFSRQRFWGEPIPMIHCDDCGWVCVPESELPVVLPDVENYEPTETGESPLANIPEWVNTKCPKCGKDAKRETDTMPNWAGSSWYWLRYMDARNDKEFVSMDALKYWGMVDYYNGGMEHATRHLLYARFWHQFLYNQGLVPFKEPFKKRVAHGMILGENGEKMSKSRGNVVNPDDMIRVYGADALRVYEMFIGDYEHDAAWSENGLKGVRRFLDRVERLGNKLIEGDCIRSEVEVIFNQTIKKVTDDILSMKYNTAVSALMILLNAIDDMGSVNKCEYRVFLHLLNPMAPHVSEELNEMYGLGEMFVVSSWPSYDESKLTLDEKEIGVQVNGKLRASIKIKNDDSKEEVEKKALSEENVLRHIDGKEVKKVIVVPGRIVNVIVSDK